MRVETLIYVNANLVLTEEQLEYISWNLPASWGDNNFTLISKERVVECLKHEFELVEFAKLIHLPSNCYINLEAEE